MELLLGLALGTILGLVGIIEPTLSVLGIGIAILCPLQIGLGVLITSSSIGGLGPFLKILTSKTGNKGLGIAAVKSSFKTYSLVKIISLSALILVFLVSDRIDTSAPIQVLLPFSALFVGLGWIIYIAKEKSLAKVCVFSCLVALSYFSLHTQGSNTTVILFALLYLQPSERRFISIQKEEELRNKPSIPLVYTMLKGSLSSLLIGFPTIFSTSKTRIEVSSNRLRNRKEDEVVSLHIEGIISGISQSLGFFLFFDDNSSRDRYATLLSQLFNSVSLEVNQKILIMGLLCIFSLIAWISSYYILSIYIRVQNFKAPFHKYINIINYVVLGTYIMTISINSISIPLFVVLCLCLNHIFSLLKIEEEFKSSVTFILPCLSLLGLI